MATCSLQRKRELARYADWQAPDPGYMEADRVRPRRKDGKTSVIAIFELLRTTAEARGLCPPARSGGFSAMRVSSSWPPADSSTRNTERPLSLLAARKRPVSLRHIAVVTQV